MSIADRVKKLRLAADMTQAEFAERLMISRDYLSQIEGGREPSSRLAMQIDLIERLGLDAIGVRTDAADKVGTVGMLKEDGPTYGQTTRPATRADCEALFKQFMAAAEKDPNGIPHAYMLIRQYLRPEVFQENAADYRALREKARVDYPARPESSSGRGGKTKAS